MTSDFEPNLPCYVLITVPSYNFLKTSLCLLPLQAAGSNWYVTTFAVLHLLLALCLPLFSVSVTWLWICCRSLKQKIQKWCLLLLPFIGPNQHSAWELEVMWQRRYCSWLLNWLHLMFHWPDFEYCSPQLQSVSMCTMCMRIGGKWKIYCCRLDLTLASAHTQCVDTQCPLPSFLKLAPLKLPFRACT